MSFLHIEIFYYLLAPFLILFGFLLTQKEAQAHFFSEEVMSKLRVSANTLTLKARNALFFTIGLLIIIALSGPVINEGEVEVKAKSADIMIALDISDSMLAEDIYPNRLKSAKQKMLEMLKIAPTERIGVIAFAKNSYLVSPLSFDHKAVSFLLSKLSTDSITEKGTDFLSMLQVVENSGENSKRKYLLILSDGGDKEDFSEELEYAKEHNIVVFILGVATSKGAPIKLENGSFIKQNGEIIISKLNDNIEELATKSGGVYIESVNSDEDIRVMLQEIESLSDKKELKSEMVERYIPLFYYPLGLALFLLLVATSSMSKRQRVALPMLFLLINTFLNPSNTNAGVLDFIELNKAKEAYNLGDFNTSKRLYENYAQKSENQESQYNTANSLYKQGLYKEAIKSYKKVEFKDKVKEASKYANLGNAYVKGKEKESLEKAVEAYEKSLKLKDDKETQENLEAVKKVIEKKQKKDKKKKENKEEKQDKDKKKENNKNKKSDEKESKSDKDSKDNKDSKGKKDSQNRDNDTKNKSDKKNEENKKRDSQKEKKKDKNKLKELDKSDENSSKKEGQVEPKDIKSKMSDKEEAKWLKAINSQQSTFMYMLNNQRNRETDLDEKPW